ncbi:DeoR/GlpR family DNA-binding transcription regulator [Planctomycetaceae bacterium SH139]
MASSTATDQRRQQLRRLLQTQGFASLGDLSDALQVSDSTIRRDLENLEDLGEAKRTHGGVFWTGSPSSMLLFEGRQDSLWETKRRIAQAAAELIADNETILLDGGSTTYELARCLVGRPLQVVTNSLPVANLFASSDSVDLIFLGGYVHGRTGVSVGPLATELLSQISVRRAFISIAGADAEGYYNSNFLLVETEQAMLRSADETVIVADSSKFGHASLARVCRLGEVHTVVSDAGLDREWQQRLCEAGVRLMLTDP